MKRIAALAVVLSLPAFPAARATAPAPEIDAATAGSRVIVSTTLNDTLQFFDAVTLTQLQPPLPSKGGGPVRMTLFEDPFYPDQPFEYLFVANHGVAEGSVGVFDVAGDTVLELPLSPFPARPGSVGIAAARLMGRDLNTKPIVAVTNTHNALAGCGVPSGSVSLFDADRLASHGMLVHAMTMDTSGAQPWGVTLDPAGGRAFVSSNCSDTLDTITLHSSLCYPPMCTGVYSSKTATRATGDGPDGSVFDADRRLVFTVNIAGSSVSVHDPTSPGPVLTIPLPGARPIDAALGESASGRAWLLTSNGGDDSVSVIDRDVVAACVAAAASTCPGAEVARIATAVPGGAPEGVAFDAATNRVFAVNKTFPPTLSVLQLQEHASGAVTGADIARIPLNAAGTQVPLPAFIAFDVIVHPR